MDSSCLCCDNTRPQPPLSPETLVTWRAGTCYPHVSLDRAVDLETAYLDHVTKYEAPYWPPLDGKGRKGRTTGPVNEPGERTTHADQGFD